MMYKDLFSEEEWVNLVATMQKITNHIPDSLMGLVWSSYQRINKTNTPQPCGCPSAARYWIEAVNVINTYIKERV